MKPFSKRKIVTIRPVRIVGDGALGMHGVGEGRMIPVVILDANERPDIVEYIRLHQFSGLGDVKVTWGKPLGRRNTVSLMLNFVRPMELSFAILFELESAHSILVESALHSGGLYLQAGANGDRIRNTLDQPRVIIEVPDTGFRPRWEKICLAYLGKKLRAEGVDRKSVKRIAAEQYEKLQELAASRPFRS